MIKEGKKCIDNGKIEDALELLNEANGLEKWKDLYGGTILSNLGITLLTSSFYHYSIAYATAMKGNKPLAKHYLSEYKKRYGDHSFEDDEVERLMYAREMVEQSENET